MNYMKSKLIHGRWFENWVVVNQPFLSFWSDLQLKAEGRRFTHAFSDEVLHLQYLLLGKLSTTTRIRSILFTAGSSSKMLLFKNYTLLLTLHYQGQPWNKTKTQCHLECQLKPLPTLNSGIPKSCFHGKLQRPKEFTGVGKCMRQRQTLLARYGSNEVKT